MQQLLLYQPISIKRWVDIVNKNDLFTPLLDAVQDDLRYSFDGHRTGLEGDLPEIEEEEEEEEYEEDGEGEEEAPQDQLADDGEDQEEDHEAIPRPHSSSIILSTPSPESIALLNKRKQSTYFNALRAEDDPLPPPDHPLRFRANEMELFRDSPVRVSSRRAPSPLRQQRRRRKRRRRRHLTTRPTFEYSWTKNGLPLDLEATDVFELAKDGTLRITHSEQAAGIYRCVINGTRWGFGALISRDSNVTLAGE